MFNVMNEKELREVNGGNYLVPVYVYDSKGYKCFRGTTWVSNNSNIKCFIDGVAYYY